MCKGMKKIGFLFVGVALVLCCLTACNKIPNKEDIPNVSDVNYNNYFSGSIVDCKDGYIAVLDYGIVFDTLTVYDETGVVAKIRNVEPEFQIYDNCLFYIEYFSGKLKMRNLQTGETTQIGQDVMSVVVHESGIYYIDMTEWDDGSSYRVYRYLPTEKSYELLYKENADKLFLYKDQVYIIANFPKYELFRIGTSDQIDRLCEVGGEAAPWGFLSQRDKLLMFENVPNLTLEMIDMESGQTEEMTIFTDRCWANDKVNPTCDETHLYFSFHATKTNGSIVTKVKSKNNGVWYVNTETKEIRKICDMYFEDLFLCDDVLLGASGKSLYRIDVETGEIKKII